MLLKWMLAQHDRPKQVDRPRGLLEMMLEEQRPTGLLGFMHDDEPELPSEPATGGPPTDAGFIPSHTSIVPILDNSDASRPIGGPFTIPTPWDLPPRRPSGSIGTTAATALPQGRVGLLQLIGAASPGAIPGADPFASLRGLGFAPYFDPDISSGESDSRQIRPVPLPAYGSSVVSPVPLPGPLPYDTEPSLLSLAPLSAMPRSDAPAYVADAEEEAYGRAPPAEAPSASSEAEKWKPLEDLADDVGVDVGRLARLDPDVIGLLVNAAGYRHLDRKAQYDVLRRIQEIENTGEDQISVNALRGYIASDIANPRWHPRSMSEAELENAIKENEGFVGRLEQLKEAFSDVADAARPKSPRGKAATSIAVGVSEIGVAAMMALVSRETQQLRDELTRRHGVWTDGAQR